MPISRRYSRSESSEGSTLRSSFGAFLLRFGLLVRRMLVRLALDELDAVVDQVGVEILDLILGELDILEPRSDLVVVEESFVETVLNELVQLFDVGERDVDRKQHGPPALPREWTGDDQPQTCEEPVRLAPGSDPVPGGS